jgi:hypothetical protein
MKVNGDTEGTFLVLKADTVGIIAEAVIYSLAETVGAFGLLSLLTYAFAAPFSISDGMDLEGLLLRTAIDTKASTDSISVMGVVFIAGAMAAPTTASFGKTNATDTASFPGQTVLCTKANSATECVRVMVPICLATVVGTLAPGEMVATVALARVHGRMDVVTRVNG